MHTAHTTKLLHPPLPLHVPLCFIARVFDHKLGRRRYGEYAENYMHDGDSGGIHASGAGFEKVDPQEQWKPPVY